MDGGRGYIPQRGSGMFFKVLEEPQRNTERGKVCMFTVYSYKSYRRDNYTDEICKLPLNRQVGCN